MSTKIKRLPDDSAFYRKLSQLDSLTELFNHRHFLQLLDIELNRAQRGNKPLSLVIMSADDFRLYKYKCGRAISDLALKKLAWALAHNCRRCDFTARYRDEELAVIIPDSPKQMAAIVANRIRQAVAGTEFKYGHTLPQGRFTVSLGVAEYPADAQGQDELIEKAEQALYRAKNSGKNKVCLFDAGVRLSFPRV